jgi:hypothetical protein
MFLSQVRKLRNIRWVLMFLSPTQEHKRPICESLPFFHSSLFFPLFCAPLPAAHTLATPALPRPRSASHAPPYLDLAPPFLGRVPAARPRPTACTGLTYLSHAPPSDAHWPHFAPPSSMHWPPGPAPPCPSRSTPGPTPPALVVPCQAMRTGRRMRTMRRTREQRTRVSTRMGLSRTRVSRTRGQHQDGPIYMFLFLVKFLFSD